jgi:hypothetical protein
MIHDSAENIIRLAAAHVATGTPVDRVCIILPSGTQWGAYDADLRAAGLGSAAIASPDNDAQRAEILAALATGSTLEVFY